MPFNILIINDFAQVNGGASKIAISTAIGLKQRGHEVIFFSAVPPVIELLKLSGIKIINIGQYDILSNPKRVNAAVNGLWNMKAARLLSELLNKYEPRNTIIHTHSWTKALSPSIFFPIIKKNFRFVISVHDYFLFCPNGGFYNYSKSELCKEYPMSLKCIIKNCDSRAYIYKCWRLLRHLIQNQVLKKAKDSFNLILPSEFTKRIISNYFFLRESNRYLIPNPIDIAQSQPVKAQRNDIFVYIGRFSKEKGVLIFAKAASELGIKSFFVGDGYLKDEIVKAYPKAVITGWLDKRKMRDILKSARVIVYPSLCYETQGLAVLEAKAMGIPAIVSDTCAAREYIEHGLDGLLFRSGDVYDLIDKLKICMNDSLIEKMSVKAYENYWENPQTIDNYLDSLEQVYLKILEDR